MQRLIVTSATYRQSSERDAGAAREGSREPAAGARPALPPAGRDDPRQRAGRERPAQRRRSAARACFPYQPTGLWEEMAFGDGFSGAGVRAEPRHGPVPPQHVHVLEAHRAARRRSRPSTRPIARSARRAAPLTNTPLQALVLLNDPTYVEAARALAQRALLEGGKDRQAGVVYAFRLATARHADAARKSASCASLLKATAGVRSRSDRRRRPSKLIGRRRVAARQPARRRRAGRLDDGRERRS